MHEAMLHGSVQVQPMSNLCHISITQTETSIEIVMCCKYIDIAKTVMLGMSEVGGVSNLPWPVE